MQHFRKVLFAVLIALLRYRYMSLEQNDSKDRTLFVLINKALLFCFTVHKTIDIKWTQMYVQYLNRISFVFFYENHNHSVLTVILFQWHVSVLMNANYGICMAVDLLVKFIFLLQILCTANSLVLLTKSTLLIKPYLV